MSLTNKNNCCGRSFTLPSNRSKSPRFVPNLLGTHDESPRFVPNLLGTHDESCKKEIFSLENKQIIDKNLIAANAVFNNLKVENTATIPNTKYNIDTTNTTLGASQIRASRFFSNNSDFSLSTDASLNGIEIIIYNNGTNTISVKDNNLITTIEPESSKTLAFVNKWIIIS